MFTVASDHLMITMKANHDVGGDGSALEMIVNPFIDTNPACVDFDFKCGHISTLLDHDNVDSQPNTVDIDTPSRQVDVDTEPRYDDTEIQLVTLMLIFTDMTPSGSYSLEESYRIILLVTTELLVEPGGLGMKQILSCPL